MTSASSMPKVRNILRWSWREGEKVRLFWASEMTTEMADPGQDPRGALHRLAVVDPRPHAHRPQHRLVPKAQLLKGGIWRV
jgi:hypothetical protein